MASKKKNQPVIFIFDGKNIKIRPRAITKYYYQMRRKAHTIGHNNWTSPKGKNISAKNFIVFILTIMKSKLLLIMPIEQNQP